ncbi:hypothetical protein L0663_21825 [Dyadobacter sp. CY107]|uniref:hypothetical protein n=1 Tax=Dyadobacter fanqingshengii TaxID=2906443 RepID=UPI001F231288|nr:hypothetical protein [Dyadobacter fanqingshengii]MCF2506051.1 hypothetical protein [Dyadobacter fanqingshengii]
MRRIYEIIMLYLLYGSFVGESYAQLKNTPPCKEVERVDLESDSVKRQILVDFIFYCEEKSWKNDKGIVILTEYVNEDGKQCWLLAPSIDDHYKDNPPKKFGTLNGDIILIMEGDAIGMQKSRLDAKNTDKINECLDKIIGDRVYIRPAVKTRWADGIRPFTTEKITEGRHRWISGDGGSIIIIFNSDGTYKKGFPV